MEALSLEAVSRVKQTTSGLPSSPLLSSLSPFSCSVCLASLKETLKCAAHTTLRGVGQQVSLRQKGSHAVDDYDPPNSLWGPYGWGVSSVE